jgi:hypothetical protein
MGTMLKFALVLLTLLTVETYGVYGAWKAKKLAYTCKVEVGPLCYAWEESALGKLLGEDGAEALEGKFERAEEVWEEQVLERARRAAKDDRVGEVLEEAGDAVKGALDAVKGAAEEALE